LAGNIILGQLWEYQLCLSYEEKKYNTNICLSKLSILHLA